MKAYFLYNQTSVDSVRFKSFIHIVLHELQENKILLSNSLAQKL